MALVPFNNKSKTKGRMVHSTNRLGLNTFDMLKRDGMVEMMRLESKKNWGKNWGKRINVKRSRCPQYEESGAEDECKKNKMPPVAEQDIMDIISVVKNLKSFKR